MLARQPDKPDPTLFRQAIASAKAAASVLTAESDPQFAALVTQKLANHKKNYLAAGLEKQLPFDDIKPIQ